MPPMLQGLNTLALLQGMGGNRAQARAGIGGADRIGGMESGSMPSVGGSGVDIMAALSSGVDAADGGSDTPDTGGGNSGAGAGDLSDMSPMLASLTRRLMAQDDTDVPLSKQDKGLALAQAGFAMASSKSPQFLGAVGEGGQAGIEGLEKLRQQRALQRMRQGQMLQTGLLSAERLKQQQTAEQDKVQAEKDRNADRDATRAQQKQISDDNLALRKLLGEQGQGAKDAAAQALFETRYNTADLRRKELYAKTGQWSKIVGDDEHGITGAPEADKPYSGPVVDDPSIGYKERQKLTVAKPAQTQALSTIELNFNNAKQGAQELLAHPGLSNAVGFGGKTVSKIPGTDAANFGTLLHTLKSQVFANALQSMRDASKTGGAVGNVSDKEGDRFEAMLGSLDQAQDEDQFKEQVGRVINFLDGVGATYKQKYSDTYGEFKPDVAAAPPAGTAPPGGTAPLTIEQRMKKYPLGPK